MNIIIVGGGIAGLSSAWALTKRGHQVTLLEQGPIPNPLGASGDHHRIIRRAYGATTGYGAVITEAYAAWDELWDDLGESHYDPRGFMAVSRQPGDEAEVYREGLESGNYPFELLQPKAAAERWPFLEAGAFRYAFFSGEGGALHCRRIAEGLARWLDANGADLRPNNRVAEVNSTQGSVTLADGTLLSADRIVVTAGAWVLKLFPELADRLTAYRTAVVYLEPPADLAGAWAAAPVILDIGGRTDGYIIPPSGAGGLKFGSGLHKFASPDADANRAAEPGEGEAIRDLFAPPIARIGEYRVADVKTCVYTFTADERFLGAELGRAVVVSACSGHGYKFGTAVGRRVADAIESGDTGALAKWLRAESA